MASLHAPTSPKRAPASKARAAIRPIVGKADVVKFFRRLLRRFAVGPDVRIVQVNGLPAASRLVRRQGPIGLVLGHGATDRRTVTGCITSGTFASGVTGASSDSMSLTL